MNKHWENIGSGDGFHAYVDRADGDIVYLEWQGGRMQRMRKSSGEVKDIQPLEQKEDPKYRFGWNAAMHVDSGRFSHISVIDNHFTVVTVVPEPNTAVLMGGGLLGLCAWRSRRRR